MIAVALGGVENVGRNLDRAAKAVMPAAYASTEKAGKWLEGKLKANRFRSPGRSMDAVRTRTGALASSIHSQVKVTSGTAQAMVGTPVKYAKALEHGATIRPVNAKFLAIPIGEAMTGTGAARGKPRSFPNAFIAQSLKGQYLIFQKTGPTTCVPIFLLRKRVILPARHLFEKERKACEPQLRKIMGDETVKTVVRIGNGGQ